MNVQIPRALPVPRRCKVQLGLKPSRLELVEGGIESTCRLKLVLITPNVLQLATNPSSRVPLTRLMVCHALVLGGGGHAAAHVAPQQYIFDLDAVERG
eukprot:CAMPEP_0179114608 /NCGR_PEP_ID=MMETSP0796-20121207/53673_1 /TAXON_ID=73915 /ORGANISM="Pyrodinium bahamense, Strain pbaha01" /LENGTH=97 /DNA_ID=CAMNT_0020812835 /DNA_START=500 /DNA_END=793 /DNA_ORIENTATION=+